MWKKIGLWLLRAVIETAVTDMQKKGTLNLPTDKQST